MGLKLDADTRDSSSGLDCCRDPTGHGRVCVRVCAGISTNPSGLRKTLREERIDN